jgi:outer membrane protein assembly factor BamB
MTWRWLSTLALALLLAGCGTSASKLLNFGKNDDTVLPGKRESVLQSNTATADQAIASDPIVVPAAQPNPSWSQPGGASSNALHNLSLNPQLARAFAASAGKGSSRNGRLTASPIVVGGRLFVLDAESRVRALSADRGNSMWATSLIPDGKDGRGAFGGGLASDGSRLYATTAFGEALALDPATGQVIWRKSIGTPIRSSPTVAAGRMVFVTSGNQVFCLSTSDGSELWNSQGVGEQAAVIASTSPAIADDTVVVPLTSGDITALNLSTGAPLWTDSLASTDATSSLANLNDISARPVIDDGQVFAISHSGVFAAFDLASGQRLWHRDLSGTHTPWVSGDYVFLITGRNKIVAVSRKSGGVRWIRELPAGNWAGPVMGGGKLIAASSEGALALVSAQTGDLLNSIELGSRIFIDPIIAAGTLYVLGDDGDIIALR